ncbi:MAG: transaldolase, partial [Pricia sp.]
GDRAIDSAKLDQENRFSFRLDSISGGLHHFNHGNELQYVYLEGGDSLVIRLNTLYFDESLIFSGVGEEINNFLLERFLRHEEENDLSRNLYRLEAKEFEKTIDSLNAAGLAELADLKQEGTLSEKEEKIARASIDYHYDTYKEKYPFKHKRTTGHRKAIAKLPSDFYDYRKQLTYNDTDFTYLRPYYNFMINHVGNLSYMTCSKNCGLENGVAHNQLHFNHHKLNIIDSLMVEKELKDNLYRYVAIDYLVNVHDSEKNNEEFIESFHKLSNNNRHMEEINKLYKGILNLQPNRKIPDIKVSGMQGKVVSLQDIAKEKDHKTVFYFWSGSDRRHFENMNKRVSLLASERPEYSFVGINVKTDENNWKALVRNSGLDTTKQFRSSDFEALTEALIVYPLNKCIITNDNGMIVDAFANVYEPL